MKMIWSVLRIIQEIFYNSLSLGHLNFFRSTCAQRYAEILTIFTTLNQSQDSGQGACGFIGWKKV